MKTPAFLDDLPVPPEMKRFFSKLRVPSRKEFVNWWRRSGLVAILALFASTVIYLGLQEKITQKDYTVKVAIRSGEESSSRLFASKPATVEVTLSGAFSELQLFDASKLEVVLPGGAIKTDLPGSTTYVDIRDHYVKGTSGLNVIRIKPDRVLVSSDTRAARSFQIATPRMEVLKPFKGHAEIQVRPNRANVTGWNSQLDTLANSGAMLELRPIRVDGSVPSFSQEVDVFPPATEDDRPLSVSPSRVTVTVTIVPDTIERILSNITVNASIPAGGIFPPGYTLSSNEVVVSLTGQEESISALVHQDVRATVEIPTYTNRPGETLLPVHVYFPPNVMASSVKVIPPSVTLLPPPPPVVAPESDEEHASADGPSPGDLATSPPSTNVPPPAALSSPPSPPPAGERDGAGPVKVPDEAL